jgi:glycosyltransferase involved in cell wall biosynthesis
MSFASVILLSYERPNFLLSCIENLKEAGEPFELIVHDDGSADPAVPGLLDRLLEEGIISTLIRQPIGHNQGVGEAVRKGFAVAQGDVLIKADQDLVFAPGWLTRCREVLDDDEVGAAGAFSYHHDPVDVQKTRILDKVPPNGMHHFYVTDFVGSLFAIPRHVYEQFGPIPSHSDAFAEDIELKQRIRAGGYELALPQDDFAMNVGFGVGPSTVVVAEGQVREIEHAPLLAPGTVLNREPVE